MLIAGYLLIATSHITNVNKAAIAMFVGTVGWVLYICYGTDFVMSQYPREYSDFLIGTGASGSAVKTFIYENIFLKYVGKAASVVMFILATMTIVEILDNNGCFDFIGEWVRTRSGKRMLWTITATAFLISANLDTLTTSTMMLMIMHGIVQSRRQRMVIGSGIVLAANAGGCFTVIGDPAGLILWGSELVTATNFSAWLVLPAVMAWTVPTFLLGRSLPDRLDVDWQAAPYRGDDTNLNRWQRVVMLIVGIGGLWFIPTFHNITRLSPFLGALCVLSVLWGINEIFNRKLMNAEQMILRRTPRVLQYGSIQLMLFVMGVMLALGAVKETGVLADLSEWIDYNVHNIWITGFMAGVLSGCIDSFSIAMTSLSMYPVVEPDVLGRWMDADYMANFVQNGMFWKVIAFTTATGGCLLGFTNASVLAMMKMERMHIGWYLKNCTLKVLVGWIIGMVVLWGESLLFG